MASSPRNILLRRASKKFCSDIATRALGVSSCFRTDFNFSQGQSHPISMFLSLSYSCFLPKTDMQLTLSCGVDLVTLVERNGYTILEKHDKGCKMY